MLKGNTMAVLKNTTCFSVLFLSVPLMVPDVCSASYGEYVLPATESGNTKVFDASEKNEYSKVIMGQAISSDSSITELKASNNSATFNSGVNVQSEVIGGEASYQVSSSLTKTAVEASSNTITFVTGSSFKSAENVSEDRYIYGGKASIGEDDNATVDGTVTAGWNTVDIQSGSVIGAEGKITIVGGLASNEGDGSCDVYSYGNTVTMNGSAFEGSADAPLEFAQITAGVALTIDGVAEAGKGPYYDGKTNIERGNQLTITSLDNAVIGKVAVAEASSSSSKYDASAHHAQGSFEFGDNVYVDTVYGTHAKSMAGATAHCSSLSLSGGHAQLVIGSYAEGASSSAFISNFSVSNVNVASVSSDSFNAEKTEFYGARAVGYSGAFTVKIENSNFSNIYGAQTVGNDIAVSTMTLTDVTTSRYAIKDEAGNITGYTGGYLYGSYANDGEKNSADSELKVRGGRYENDIYAAYSNNAYEITYKACK